MKFLDNIKKNQSLMRFIETTQSHMVTAEIGNSSVVVAYYLLLSLFPLLIAVGNVLPYLRIDPNSELRYFDSTFRGVAFCFRFSSILECQSKY